MKQTLTTLTPLLVVFTVLLSSHFIDAAWIAPSGQPSADNNAPAPINVSAENQLKSGDLTVLYSKAGAQMWSPEYCDENGENCFRAEEVNEAPAPQVPATRVFQNPRKNGMPVATFGGNGWTTWTQWCQENGYQRATEATMGPTARPCAGNTNRAGAFINWRYDWYCNYATVGTLTCAE